MTHENSGSGDAEDTLTDTAPNNSRSSGTARSPHPRDPNRAADGTWRTGGDGGNLQHGLRRFETRGVLPDDLQARVEAFRAGLVADRGGASDMSTVETGYVCRLAQLEGALELLGRDLAQRGVLTDRGRPRAAYLLFLRTLETWDRLGQRLGMERKAKPLTDAFDVLREYEGRSPSLGTPDPPADDSDGATVVASVAAIENPPAPTVVDPSRAQE